MVAHRSFAGDVVHRPEVAADALWSSDILLSETRLLYTAATTNMEWSVGLGYASIDLEYRPFASFDALTSPAELHRDRYLADLELRPRISDRVTLIFSGNYHDGFRDYRTAWLDEYYRQSFSGVPGYKKAHPGGYSVGGGVRWEYLPDTGFLETSVSYAEFDVSPDYEIVTEPDTHVVRAPGSINRAGFSVASENVVTPFARILNEVTVFDTSGREVRVNYQISAHMAVGNRWVLRPHAGYSHEDPQFNSWYGGGTVEYDITSALQLFARAAYYYDTGEILDSLTISGAPPAIETYQFGLGIRYAWSRATLQIYGGPYFMRYDDLEQGTRPFTNLYRDRNWGIAQLAFSMQF